MLFYIRPQGTTSIKNFIVYNKYIKNVSLSLNKKDGETALF